MLKGVGLRFVATLAVVGLLASGGCTFRPEGADRRVKVEVAVFEGGFGLDWHRDVVRQYKKLHPDIDVDLWGDPRVDEKLKPRILRRDPPDLASCTLPIWKLIVAGKLHPLDSALDSPAYGQNKTWRATLVPSLLSDYQYKGKTYSVPTNLGCWVCWYDKRQFREHGWQPPKTWGEFTALCDKIKAAGIAPLAFQGKYPTYAWSTLLSVYQRLVPFDRWYRMQDLQPGAFTDPEFIHAARLVQDMATKYFEPGALAMTHTESQMEWVNGRAAMCFCGLWLEHEMINAIPPGFEMACFPVPMVEGGKGDPNAVYAGGAEQFFVFEEAKHHEQALDFLKFMLSVGPARDYIRRIDTLSPVIGSERGVKMSSGLQSAVDIMNHSTRYYSDRLSGLYLEWSKGALQDGLADLVGNRVTPEVFGQRLETAIDEVRKNPEIYKPPARGVP